MSTTQVTETKAHREIIAEKPSRIWQQDFNMSQPTPDKQNILLLHAAKQDYEHTEEAPVPQIQSENDVLLQTKVIGLNPIDWKGPYV